MSSFHLTLIFSAISLIGFTMIVYGLLTRPKENRASIEGDEVLGFSDSGIESSKLLDDMGYEGLKHKGKEPFDPEKHRPEAIESKKPLS